MGRRAGSGPSRPWRRIDALLAWFAGGVAALCAAGILLGTGLLHSGADAGPDRATVRLGAVEASVPGRWLRPPRPSAGAVDLVLTPPDLGLPGTDERILVELVPADDAPAPADRPTLLYARFLSSAAESGPGGLVRRVFRDGTPYEGEVLYLAPPDGRAFAARCARDVPAGQAECAAAFRLKDVEARLGLPASLLPHGPAIVEQLARRLGGP